MEFANQPPGSVGRDFSPNQASTLDIQLAQKSEYEALESFIDSAFFRHVHADWYEPMFWVDEPDSVTLVSHKNDSITGCLITAADPAPAAWIRAAAFNYLGLSRQQIKEQFVAMVQQTTEILAESNINELCWMSPRRWAEPWLVDAGFTLHTTMVTYRKEDLNVPALRPLAPEFSIRPVLPEDMRRLAEIETITYDPLWRHSQRGLHKAWRNALSFDVVTHMGEVIGFQHSTRANQSDAHLARITILPDYQGKGLGSHLLAQSINHYKKLGMKHMTLNTQAENEPAQRMYRRFGFLPTHYRWPLSTLSF